MTPSMHAPMVGAGIVRAGVASTAQSANDDRALHARDAITALPRQVCTRRTGATARAPPAHRSPRVRTRTMR